MIGATGERLGLNKIAKALGLKRGRCAKVVKPGQDGKIDVVLFLLMFAIVACWVAIAFILV